MAFVKLTFNPGINRDVTNYAGEGGWYDMNRVRFLSGSPQGIGGWAKASVVAFHGVARGMHNWYTTFDDNFLAIGTNDKLYIEAGGNFFDITPLREANPVIGPPNTDNAVYTYVGLAVADISTGGIVHELSIGSFVTISGVVGPIGGIPDTEINGNHEIIAIISPTGYRIATTTPATATVAGGGGVNITMEFEIASGSATGSFGYGWGAGTWGRGTWGSGATTPIVLPELDWFYDSFDNDLYANIRGGAIYFWPRGADEDPVVALNKRAILLADAALADGYDPLAVPERVTQILMSQQDQHLIAFGAQPYKQAGTFDPMLIRWSDQTNVTEWTPTPLNSAGDIRLTRGSKIIRALPTRQEILVWTDAKLYTLQFLGTTDVYGVQEYADNISVMSPRSMITASNVTYWMGQDKFYMYTGRVDTMPCTVRSYVFNDLNLGQAAQVVCGTNEKWNEVWWHYPSKSSQINDRYVIYNYIENIWYYGKLQRTGWLDSPLRQVPQAVRVATEIAPNPYTGSVMSFLINQETGLNDELVPMNSYILASDFDLGDGDNFMLTRRIIPDLTFEGSLNPTPQVLFQLLPRNFPGGSPDADADDEKIVSSSSVGVFTKQIFVRARARQLGFRVSCDQLDVAWQLGVSRIDVRQDGRA